MASRNRRESGLRGSLNARLDEGRAAAYARLALAGIDREWPHAYQHLAGGPRDLARPRRQHPAFFGCYDWHSAVHGHWLLARLRSRLADARLVRRIDAALDGHLTARNLRREADYFAAPGRATFERPYGWGWLLALAAELRSGGGAAPRRWARNVRPLETAIVARFSDWLPKLRQPIRSGAHSSTAFGLVLALDYSRAVSNRALEGLIVARSRAYFGRDRGAPAAWEPNGDDFLSPSLVEADLMRRVLSPGAFAAWWRGFLPVLPPSLRHPADPGPHRDAKSIHLDGLNLSRAWCLHGIARALEAAGRPEPALARAAERHADAGLRRVLSGDYLGEHWLASFAVYLLTA